jgi:type II secretory pathway pseudopilin PulG
MRNKARSPQPAAHKNKTIRPCLRTDSTQGSMSNAVPKGMTLIEAMIWIAVFTSVMIMLTQSLLSFYRTNRYTLQEATAISSAQHSMDIVVRDLRTAAYSNNGAYPIVSIAPNQVAFYASVVKNDPLIQQVRFFVQGNSLFEGLIEPSGDPLTYASTSEVITTLSQYVQNLTVGTSTFVYFDQSGNQINDYTAYNNARFVGVNLIIDVSTSTSPNQLLLTSSAALRNIVGH